MKKLVFLDTETTDKHAEARLIQLAYSFLGIDGVSMNYYRPPVPIAISAMAIHNITNEKIKKYKPFQGSLDQQGLIERLNGAIVVAHNAKFDLQILKNEGIEASEYICTYQVAKHLIDSEAYSLQYLRYFLNLNIEDIGSAHDAVFDVIVLKELFKHLYSLLAHLGTEDAIINRMVELSTTPFLIKEFKFGKYKGKTFEEVSKINVGYLKWLQNEEMQKNKNERNVDLLFTLSTYIQSPLL